MLFLVAFPAYLIKRKSLTLQAKSSPITQGALGKIGYWSLTALFGLAAVSLMLDDQAAQDQVTTQKAPESLPAKESVVVDSTQKSPASDNANYIKWFALAPVLHGVYLTNEPQGDQLYGSHRGIIFGEIVSISKNFGTLQVEVKGAENQFTNLVLNLRDGQEQIASKMFEGGMFNCVVSGVTFGIVNTSDCLILDKEQIEFLQKVTTKKTETILGVQFADAVDLGIVSLKAQSNNKSAINPSTLPTNGAQSKYKEISDTDTCAGVGVMLQKIRDIFSVRLKKISDSEEKFIEIGEFDNATMACGAEENTLVIAVSSGNSVELWYRINLSDESVSEHDYAAAKRLGFF